MTSRFKKKTVVQFTKLSYDIIILYQELLLQYIFYFLNYQYFPRYALSHPHVDFLFTTKCSITTL
jgi:hypothetical protein